MHKISLTFFLSVFCSGILWANTCEQCDQTFWPKEGENGRLCGKCASAQSFQNAMQFLRAVSDENKKEKERENEAEARRAAKKSARRDEYRKNHYRWAIYCESSKSYSFRIQEKENKPLWGSVVTNSNYVPSDSPMPKEWIAINEENSTGKKREFYLPKRYKKEDKRINIIIKDGKDNWYGVKNLKIYYDNSEDVLDQMTMVIRPVSNGIKVKVFAGGSWDEEDAEAVVDTMIETSSDPNKYNSFKAK